MAIMDEPANDQSINPEVAFENLILRFIFLFSLNQANPDSVKLFMKEWNTLGLDVGEELKKRGINVNAQ